MTHEAFCEIHGPYDASYGSCPYCARQGRGERPRPPVPLDEEETDPWGTRRPGGISPDEEETDVGGWRRDAPVRGVDLDETVYPRRRRGLEELDVDETVVEAPPSGLLGWLIVKQGTRRGQVHSIRHGATIGRRGASVLLTDPKVSKVHAKVTVEDKEFCIWDFGSENGTYVNGERIREATPLKENDVIKMGDTEFVLKTLE